MLNRIYPYACLNIDCSWSQWLVGLRHALYSSEDRLDLQDKLSRLFSQSDNVIITMCVRSAFDLFLMGLDLPKGSEVIISSINIPEMSRILRKHCLIPVPVDIDTSTLITPASRVAEAINFRTRLIVVSMLYGVTFDLTEIGDLAKKHKLFLFEDSAECYSGNKLVANACADATVLSFGPIKTATAFCGGVIIVRDSGLLSKMRGIHAKYPMQDNSTYLKKILRYSIGMLLFNSTSVNYLIRVTSLQLNIDYKKKAVQLMRGFPVSTGLDIYRFQPCKGLLSFLYWRLNNLNETELLQSMEKLHTATEILTKNKVMVPGYKTHRKVFWLYPVVVEDAAKAYIDLNKAGIDAYKGISQLNKIDPPVGSSYKVPEETNKMFSNLLYFPLHKDVPEKLVREICAKAAEILNPNPKL